MGLNLLRMQVAQQRSRLDAPYAFGSRGTGEHAYQLENSYRGRVAPQAVLYPKVPPQHPMPAGVADTCRLPQVSCLRPTLL